MFTRSMAARSALKDSGFDLALLGTHPLGELLFSDSAFEYGPIEVRHYLAAGLSAKVRTEGLWDRCSRFSRGAFGVPVTEIFLPSLWDQAEIADV